MLPHLSHTARNMLESQHPAEPLFCLSLLLAFQLSQVSETAQMEIYSKKKAKEINETKCPKLCRKISRLGGSLMWGPTNYPSKWR